MPAAAKPTSQIGGKRDSMAKMKANRKKGSSSDPPTDTQAEKMGLGMKAAEYVAEVAERSKIEHVFLMYHPQRCGIATELTASDSKATKKSLLEGTRKSEALIRASISFSLSSVCLAAMPHTLKTEHTMLKPNLFICFVFLWWLLAVGGVRLGQVLSNCMKHECLRVLELVGLKLPIELFRMLGKALGKNSSLAVLCLNDTVKSHPCAMCVCLCLCMHTYIHIHTLTWYTKHIAMLLRNNPSPFRPFST
jgi:hypothetical protein